MKIVIVIFRILEGCLVIRQDSKYNVEIGTLLTILDASGSYMGSILGEVWKIRQPALC